MPQLSWNETKDRSIAFAREWKDAAHEEQQKHLFWIGFFECFGVPLKSVAVFERAVENLKGTYSFLDLFWPGVLLVEHKSRGASLDKAGSQAFAYLADLAREGEHHQIPRYVVVCDFARFVLFDLAPDEQKDLPLFDNGKAYHTVEFHLADLHRHIREFAFMRGEKPVRLDPEDPANLKATQLLADLHDALESSGFTGHSLERMLVRLLFCLFAEDTGIFEPMSFTRLVERSDEDGRQLGSTLAHFFQILDTPEDRRPRHLDEDLAAFPYVNGGLFAETLPIAFFDASQRAALLACGHFYWARISPAVFGSLFQGVMEKRERRQLGAHYTTERDILKLLRALFLDNLRAELDSALADRSTRRTERLRDFQKKLRRLRIFDPACGCGNFLILAYRELRRLENAAVTALHTVRGKVQQQLDVRALVQVDVDQFHGLEIGEWPVRIAEVGLWLADHQCNVELAEALGQTFRRLPLRASPTIKVCNALREDWRAFLPPSDDTLIVGNPPFVGGKFQTPEQRTDMEHVCSGLENYGLLDYVTAWYVKAAQYLTGGKSIGRSENPNRPDDTKEMGSARAPRAVSGALAGDIAREKAPIATHTSTTPDGSGGAPEPAREGACAPHRIHVAFVSTNSITQGEQVGILWGHLFQHYRIKIHFAHRTFSWMSEARGKAHVHVVIIGFAAFDTVPKRIFDTDATTGNATTVTVANISPYLVEGSDTAVSVRTDALCDVPKMSWGNKPTDGGHFLLSPEERAAILAAEPQAAPFIHRYMGGGDFLNGLERYCLWLVGADPSHLRRCPRVLERVEAVRVFRKGSKAESTRRYAEQPTLFRQIAQPGGRYLAVPEVSSENRRYIPMAYLDADVICSNTVQFIPDATLYHFGILTSSMHMAWVRTVCGRLKSDYRYSNSLVYNNYPWPAPLAAKERAAIEACAQAVLDARAAFPHSTLADLYNPLTMPVPLTKAHTALDRAVDRAYATAAGIKGGNPFPTDRARVEHLFALYEKLTAPLLPAVKPTRGRKPTGLYARKPKEPPTGKATPESEAAAAHFHTIIGKEDPRPYGTPSGSGADSPAP